MEAKPDPASLAAGFMPRIPRIAAKVAARYGAHDREELESSGYVGLAKAIDRWLPERGDFVAFAYVTVRCAMLDCLRRSRPAFRAPRRRNGNFIPRVLTLGDPEDPDGAAGMLSYNRSPSERLEVQELFEAATAGIKPAARQACHFRFVEGRTLGEVGECIGYSKGGALSLLNGAMQIVQANANRHMRGE